MEPDKMTLLSEHQGIAEAPVARVRAALLAVPRGEMLGSQAPLVLGVDAHAPVVVTGGPRVYRAEVSKVAQTIEVDRDAGWVQVRGQLWRCVRFHALDHPEGALVVQCTFSYAAGQEGELVTATLGRWHESTGRHALVTVLDALAARLGCRVRILAD